MSDINFYCRLCAVKQPKFRLITDSASNKKQLDEHILRYLCIKIDNSDYPKNICIDCANIILNFHIFVQKVETAQSKLHNLVINETVPIKTEPVEFIDENIASNNLDDSEKSTFQDEHNSALAWLLNENGASSNSVEFKQEIDLETQFSDNNLENSLESKTTELIDNVSLENNESDNVKLEKPGRSKNFKKYRIWECYRCNKGHVKLESLQKHFESVHQAPVEYICYKCQGLFNDVSEYKRHLSNDHAINLTTDNVARFKCKICGFGSNKVTNFRHHQLTHSRIKEYKCDVCDRKFSLKQHLRSHSLTHKQEMTISNTEVELPGMDRSLFSDQFKCFECERTFNKLGALEKHMTEIHEDTGTTYNCPRCDTGVMQKTELIEHLKFDHKRYQCRICEKEMENRSAFVYHHYMHKGIKRFSCDVCDKTFTLKQHAKLHKLQHEKANIKCDQCQKVFSSEILLRKHQKTHEPKQFECDICLKKFVNKYYVVDHKKMVHEEQTDAPYVCEKCGKSFKRKGPLVLHGATHISVKTYRCDKCPKAFKSMYILKNHKQVHVMTKQFKCDLCATEFKHRRSLSRHVRIHKNKMPFECEFCKKTFREKYYLTVHLRQHTGERPYACLECNHYFTNDSNFKKHLRGRHGLETFSIVNNHQYPFVNKLSD